MKKKELNVLNFIGVLMISTNLLIAQEDQAESKFNVGADVFSNYIWRGSKYGKGPAFQPSVKYASGGLTVGVWGSFDASGYAETDPYIYYALPAGFTLGLTDYYFPELKVFEVSDTAGSHALEINAGFAKGGLSLNANYIVNEAGGAGSAGGDKYFEAAYDFNWFNLFLGAGDGWHTSDGKFAICNLGIESSRTIKVTEYFNIPVTGQIVLNPQREQLFVVVGFSF